MLAPICCLKVELGVVLQGSLKAPVEELASLT